MKRTLVALGLMTITMSSAIADDTKAVGSFIVLTEKDPFGGKDTVIAVTGSGSWAVGFRCLQSKLSVVVMNKDKQFTDGDSFMVKLRADNKDIFEEKGDVLSKNMVEIDGDVDKIMDQVAGAKSFSVRLMGNTIDTATVQTKQSEKVIGIVKAACAGGT